MTKKRTTIFLLITLMVGLFFRTWQINNIPPGLYPDEAMNGNDALDKLQLFYPNNNGREGLFIWITSLLFSLLQVSILTLRLPSVIIGTFTILGTFLLSKELFFDSKQKNEIALLSSFLIAISFWHVNFSRIAFRGILVPFLLVFSFYFLLKSFRTKKVINSVFSGLFYGLGFYTYSPFYLSVLLLILTFFLYWKEQKNSSLKIIFPHLISTFLIALPMGILLITNPQQILNRGSQVSIFNTENPIFELLKSLLLHLGMFNIVGDQNWRHNFPNQPQLHWLVGLFFLTGILIIIKKIINQKNNKSEKITIGWFLIMLLPGILTSQGCPHALRVIGSIPAIYIISSLGLIYFLNQINQFLNKKQIKILVIAILIFISVFQFDNYFYKWGKKQETKNAFSEYYVQIGQYFNSLPVETNKIIIINFSNTPKPWPLGLPISAQTTMFVENTANKKSIYLLPNEINKIKNQDNTIIAPINKNDSKLFKQLQEQFPNGKIINKNNILIFKI